VEALNESFTQPVVLTATGGRRGGGASVTPFGRQLIRRYRVMEDKASAAIVNDLRLFTRLMKRQAGARGAR
jgi:molybdate transport system regulatory protein